MCMRYMLSGAPPWPSGFELPVRAVLLWGVALGMSSNQYNANSTLGVGLGLRVPHYQHILTQYPAVDWFEIISENFLVDGGRPLEVLDAILERYTVVMHGVSLYFGSTDKVDRDHLKRLKSLVRRTNTPWVTDHLCWGSVDGRYSHDLLPLPYTRAAIETTAAKIRYVRDVLEVPILFENVSSYTEFTSSTMTEWEFVAEVAEKADCGILLDVNNIYVSARNHGFDPYHYIRHVPADRVAQLHIAGHAPSETLIIDTHDRAPIEPVWALYEAAIAHVGRTPTLLEWDASIPSFEEVQREANKALQWLPMVSEAA